MRTERPTAANNNVNIAYLDTDAAWDQFVTTINRSLNSLDLEFRNLQDQMTGKTLYALVRVKLINPRCLTSQQINLKGDAIAQMASTYSALEIAYFKAIVRFQSKTRHFLAHKICDQVEQIMSAPYECYSLSSIAALREIGNLTGPGSTNFSKAQAEVVLGSFVTNGWLLKSEYDVPQPKFAVIPINSYQAREIFVINTVAFGTHELPQRNVPRRHLGMHCLYGGEPLYDIILSGHHLVVY